MIWQLFYSEKSQNDFNSNCVFTSHSIISSFSSALNQSWKIGGELSLSFGSRFTSSQVFQISKVEQFLVSMSKVRYTIQNSLKSRLKIAFLANLSIDFNYSASPSFIYSVNSRIGFKRLKYRWQRKCEYFLSSKISLKSSKFKDGNK